MKNIFIDFIKAENFNFSFNYKKFSMTKNSTFLNNIENSNNVEKIIRLNFIAKNSNIITNNVLKNNTIFFSINENNDVNNIRSRYN